MTPASSLRPLPAWLAIVAGCGPGLSPSGGSQGGTGSAASSSDDGSLDATDQVDTATADSTGVEDEFACPGARWYEGDLEIDDTTDLDALRDIGGVTGFLSVFETTNLVDLEFLSCLEVVGAEVSISANEGLASLRGLERLHSMGEDGTGFPSRSFRVTQNPALTRIDSLDSLATIPALFVVENASLQSIELAALRSIDSLNFGDLCTLDASDVLVQPLAHLGTYPALERVGVLGVAVHPELTSLDSVIELAERGVVFEEAGFGGNYGLPSSEIEAFGLAAGIEPQSCRNLDNPLEECPQCPTD